MVASIVGIHTVASHLNCRLGAFSGSSRAKLGCSLTRPTRPTLQRASLGRFGAPDRRVHFTPDRLVLETDTGEVIERRDTPRIAFAGHSLTPPGISSTRPILMRTRYGLILTQPFLYAYPDFVTEEVDPWEEDGESWRRLKVIFPDNIASHAREQITYFGPDGLMRRHDYIVDVLGGAAGAHYIHDYQRSTGSWCPIVDASIRAAMTTNGWPNPCLCRSTSLASASAILSTARRLGGIDPGAIGLGPKPRAGRIPLVAIGRARQSHAWLAANTDAWI